MDEGSQHPPLTNAIKDRQIVRLALQNRITTSRTISQEIVMLDARPVSVRSVLWCFDAAWPVSSATITSASLDNAAQRKMATLVL